MSKKNNVFLVFFNDQSLCKCTSSCILSNNVNIFIEKKKNRIDKPFFNVDCISLSRIYYIEFSSKIPKWDKV